jgi:hypothetical protein
MELILIFFALLIVFNIAALFWGCDSRDTINSREWERRRQWELRLPMHHF